MPRRRVPAIRPVSFARRPVGLAGMAARCVAPPARPAHRETTSEHLAQLHLRARAVIPRHYRRPLSLNVPAAAAARLRRDRADDLRGRSTLGATAQRRRTPGAPTTHRHRRRATGRLSPALALRQGLPPQIRTDAGGVSRRRSAKGRNGRRRTRASRQAHTSLACARRRQDARTSATSAVGRPVAATSPRASTPRLFEPEVLRGLRRRRCGRRCAGRARRG
jgi:hypothetical protein